MRACYGRADKCVLRKKRMNVPDVLVINVDSRTDRWASIERNWKNSGIFPHLKRFSAYISKQRHRGPSLSHILAVLEYFKNNTASDMILVMEDDALPMHDIKTWNNSFTALHSGLSSSIQWKVVVLSPLLSPGIVQVRKHESNDAMSHIVMGTNLSAALVLYHRRIVPFLNKWRGYYQTDRSRYAFGIDRLLARLSTNEHLIATQPLAEQDTSSRSNNPGAFSQRLCKMAQQQSHFILERLQLSRETEASAFNAVYFSVDSVNMLLLLAQILFAVIISSSFLRI